MNSHQSHIFKPVVFGLMQPKGKGLVLTKHEKYRLEVGQLRTGCEENQDGTFQCIVTVNKRKHNIGRFNSVSACNAAFDENHHILMTRHRATKTKGYTKKKMIDGSFTYYSSITLDNKSYYLGTYKDSKSAASIYQDAMKQLEKGSFHEWYKNRKTA